MRDSIGWDQLTKEPTLRSPALGMAATSHRAYCCVTLVFSFLPFKSSRACVTKVFDWILQLKQCGLCFPDWTLANTRVNTGHGCWKEFLVSLTQSQSSLLLYPENSIQKKQHTHTHTPARWKFQALNLLPVDSQTQVQIKARLLIRIYSILLSY